MKLSREQLERMNIGRRYWPAEIAEIPESPHRTVLERYVRKIAEMRREGQGLFLWGPNSRGKTYGAAAVLKEAVCQRYTAYAVLTNVLKSAYIDGARFDADQTIVQRVESVDFLLIEDLGKEYSGRGSGWAELCLENLLRHRSRELMPVVCTTNLDPQAFLARYKKSAMAIVFESMFAVQVDGPDYRKKIAAKMGRTMGA